MPSAAEPWVIGGKAPDAIGKTYKGSFCAKRYKTPARNSYDSRWYGGKVVRRGSKRVFRTYWYYTGVWRARAKVWTGKKARRANEKAKQVYARYLATSSNPRSPRNCARLDSLGFRVKGARAVLVRQGSGSGRSSESPVGHLRQGRSLTNLQYFSVGANGDIRPALTTLAGVPGYLAPGTAPTRIWLAPDGKLYAFWQGGAELVTESSGQPVKCTFAQIDPASNWVECIEQSLEIEIEFGEYGPYDPGAEPVQFDGQGRIYYRAYRYSGGRRLEILRRLDSNGQKTDLLNDFQRIERWRVMANGAVVTSGYTTLEGGNYRQWLRRINTMNGVMDLFPTAGTTPWMQLLPDGNVIFPFGGIQRYEAEQDRITPFDENNYWTEIPQTGHMKYSFGFPSAEPERIYAVFGERWASEAGVSLARIWPDYEAMDTSLGQVGLVAPVSGGSALVFGTRTPGGNDYETLLVDLESGIETPIIPFNPQAKFEVYHLIDQGDGTALFDGLRFSDNRYVVGEIDLNSGAFEFLDSTGQKLVDLIGIP